MLILKESASFILMFVYIGLKNDFFFSRYSIHLFDARTEDSVTILVLYFYGTHKLVSIDVNYVKLKHFLKLLVKA